jgi:hypothetical protein
MMPEQLAETPRLLALHLADYRSRFGEIPRPDLLDLLGATEIKDEKPGCCGTAWNYWSVT